MELENGLGHLTYSTLVHPGDTWSQMRESIATYLPAVKARVSPADPFGVSLRLSAASAKTLHGDRDAREDLSAFLTDNDLYLYTVNAFPYGAFKGGRVKEQVYEPDWRSGERLAYTMAVADILAEVAPPFVAPSIQTPPLGFKPNVTGPEVVDAYTANVLELVAHLVGLERRTGRTVTLAIEPEPYCFLETTAETVAYFERHLYAGTAASRLAQLADLPLSEAHGALRRHLGVVFDICHQALEYEDMTTSIASLGAAGIPILKLQEAAAIQVVEVTDVAVEALRSYADTIYLTQTLERRDGRAKIYLNLDEAFADWEADPGPREWRVHIHVPIFLDDLGAFQSTRPAIAEALALHRAAPLSAQLEIETYTWDMLPEDLKTGDIVEYVSREIDWVRSQLEGGPATEAASASADFTGEG